MELIITIALVCVLLSKPSSAVKAIIALVWLIVLFISYMRSDSGKRDMAKIVSRKRQDDARSE